MLLYSSTSPTFMQPVENTKYPAMKPSYLAQLGQFANLPTEIRLLVWEALFHLNLSKPGHAVENPTNSLSILCCSRYLYNEIAHHLYADMDRGFLICSREPDKLGIRIQVESEWGMVERDLNDIQTVQRILERFPGAKMRDDSIHVKIRRSSKNDPGRIVLLSQRVNQFVKVLTELSYIPYVHVELIGRWNHHGEAKESIENPAEFRPDYDIVLLPFTRLSKWDYYLPEDLSNVISNEIRLPDEPITKKSMVSLLGEYESGKNGDWHCFNIGSDLVDSEWLFEQWLTDTRIFLDTRLDTLPGETANLLRRRRSAHWYEDGDTWRSQYEDQLLADISSNLPLLMKHDPHLHQARARHRCVIFIHHRIHAERDDEDAIETFIVQNWDSRVWATARPNGIEPISCPEMMTEEAVIVNDIYTYVNEMIGQFSRDLHWWGVDSKEIFEKRKP